MSTRRARFNRKGFSAKSKARRSDRHLGRGRLHHRPDAFGVSRSQPPMFWPASQKGVILYALINHSVDYSERTNSPRECIRRLKQIARGQLRVENGLVASC